MFEYFLNSISRKQVQNALGIQQARWTADPANCQKTIGGPGSYVVDDVKFHYFETLPHEVQGEIVDRMHERIYRALHEGETSTKADLPSLLHHTVWYGVMTNLQSDGSRGSWAGFKNPTFKMEDYDKIKEPISYYPIPESLQPLSRHYCLYVPELIFGVIGSSTLTKHIILYQKRPYNAHLPSTSSNLCSVHNTTNHLLQIWFHDYSHSSSSWCRLVYKDFMTKRDIGEDVTEYNIEARLMDPTSRLSKVFELEKENEKRKNRSFLPR